MTSRVSPGLGWREFYGGILMSCEFAYFEIYVWCKVCFMETSLNLIETLMQFGFLRVVHMYEMG